MIDNYWEFCCGESKLGHTRMADAAALAGDGIDYAMQVNEMQMLFVRVRGLNISLVKAGKQSVADYSPR
jgi:hypothetical protein